jgi:hypothetical protein
VTPSRVKDLVAGSKEIADHVVEAALPQVSN